MVAECSFCGFGLYNPVRAKLQITQLGLYNDARFPGRAILMFNEHKTDLEDLEPKEMGLFWKDATRVARALKRIAEAERINYAVLGNAEPHLHIHLIPRRPHEEEFPTRSPWDDPRPFEELDPMRLNSLVRGLESLLA